MAYEDKILNDMLGARVATYPSIDQQLDALWHDINSGLLGESAKTGSWFLMVKAVKDKYPKPSTE